MEWERTGWSNQEEGKRMGSGGAGTPHFSALLYSSYRVTGNKVDGWLPWLRVHHWRPQRPGWGTDPHGESRSFSVCAAKSRRGLDVM